MSKWIRHLWNFFNHYFIFLIRTIMVCLLYVLCNSQSKNGRIHTKKNEYRQHQNCMAGHHKEHDKASILHIHGCISAIYSRLHKPFKRDPYLSQIQRRYFETAHQVVPIKSSKNNDCSYSPINWVRPNTYTRQHSTRNRIYFHIFSRLCDYYCSNHLVGKHFDRCDEQNQ